MPEGLANGIAQLFSTGNHGFRTFVYGYMLSTTGNAQLLKFCYVHRSFNIEPTTVIIEMGSNDPGVAPVWIAPGETRER